jgi:hypothetical protein
MNIVSLIAALLLAAPALASDTGMRAGRASACYSISDADARAACLARVYSSPSQCYSVRDADKRAECLAETRK